MREAVCRVQPGSPRVGAHRGEINAARGAECGAVVVLGRADSVTLGGYLLGDRVWPALEGVSVEMRAHSRRKWRGETGLALISPRG